MWSKLWQTELQGTNHELSNSDVDNLAHDDGQHYAPKQGQTVVDAESLLGGKMKSFSKGGLDVEWMWNGCGTDEERM